MIQDKCITVKTEQEKLFSLFVYNSVTSSSHKPWMNILKNSTAYKIKFFLDKKKGKAYNKINHQKSNNFFYFQGACGWWKQVVEDYEVG